MIRTMRSGKVIERSQFWVGARRPRAGRKKGNSSAAKKDANLRGAVRRLAQILNCNCEHGDLLLTLTYDADHLPADAAGAEKQSALFRRRLGRVLGDAGARLRGVFVTADRDGETGEPVRLHHHAVIAGEGISVQWSEDGTLASVTAGGRDLRELWGCGGLDVELLRTQDDYTPIALYLVRQAVGGENVPKWHTTRGLKKPVIESERVVAAARALRAPGGADVKEVGAFDEYSGTHYIRYVRKPKAPKIGGHKETGGGEQNDGEGMADARERSLGGSGDAEAGAAGGV